MALEQMFFDGSTAPAKPTRRKKPEKVPGVPAAPEVEAAKRDQAIERLRGACGDLVALACDVARRIARERGSVTSTEVFAELAKTHKDRLKGADPRFMGAVFNERDVWEPLDWSGRGSHRRPVRRWKLRRQP